MRQALVVRLPREVRPRLGQVLRLVVALQLQVRPRLGQVLRLVVALQLQVRPRRVVAPWLQQAARWRTTTAVRWAQPQAGSSPR
ncbi:MAG TPA: hypothetical protein VGE11_07255, partial [Pseudonocardia sp.]